MIKKHVRNAEQIEQWMKYCTKVREMEITTKRDTSNVMGREEN